MRAILLASATAATLSEGSPTDCRAAPPYGARRPIRGRVDHSRSFRRMAEHVETTYRNPVIEEVWADPALAGPDDDGWYWCYATDDEHEPPPARRFKVARSRDLVRWETHP